MSYNPPPQPPQGEPEQPPQQYQPRGYPPPQGPPQGYPPPAPPPSSYQPQQYQPPAQQPNMPPPPPGYGTGQQGLPTQVNVVSILMFIAGGFAVLGGLLSFAYTHVGAAFAVVGLVLLVVGALEIWVGVALRQLKEWARTAAIVLAAISGLFNLLSTFKGNAGSIIGLIVDVVIIYLLMQKPVADAFARSRR